MPASHSQRCGLFVALLLLVSGCVSQRYFTDRAELPSDERALYSQAQAQLDDWNGEYEKLVSAKNSLDRFIAMNDRFLPAYVEIARYKIMLGYTGLNDHVAGNREALAILTMVQKKDPRYAKSYVLTGIVYTNLKQYDEATASLEKAEALGTEDPWLYMNWSTLLHAQGKHRAALERTKQVLRTGTNNLRAIKAAIYDLSKYSEYLDSGGTDSQVLGAVLASVTDASAQLRLAELLIDGYSGDSQPLEFARAIVERVVERDKNSHRASMLLAKYYLQRGFRYVTDIGNVYNESALALAEPLLLPLQDDPDVSNDVFETLSEIYLNRASPQLRALLEKAPTRHVKPIAVARVEARLAFQRHDFKKAIGIIEKLRESDPTFGSDEMLPDAYTEDGQLDKAEEIYRDNVTKYPNGAWIRGNYARFLLYYRRDADGAIREGEAALASMNYGLGRLVLATAYYVKAAELLKAGQGESARIYYEKGEQVGSSHESVMSSCYVHCESIRNLYAFMKAH